MKKRNSSKAIRVVLLIALVMSFHVNTAFAGEVVASLFTDESSKSTSTIGNTSGGFHYVHFTY